MDGVVAYDGRSYGDLERGHRSELLIMTHLGVDQKCLLLTLGIHMYYTALFLARSLGFRRSARAAQMLNDHTGGSGISAQTGNG